MKNLKIEVEIGTKTYYQGTAENALKLAKICSKASKQYNISIVITVQVADIYRISKEVHIPILAQHVDPITYGRYTGWILPEAVKAAGAIGSLLNHSERRLKFNVIERTIRRLKELDMFSLVCVSSLKMAKKIAMLNPDGIMIEPPKLIGTGVAISKVMPQLITKTVQEIKKINPDIQVICGAGISSREDVKNALRLGADGVGVSSFVVCAENPEIALNEILQGIIQFRKEVRE